MEPSAAEIAGYLADLRFQVAMGADEALYAQPLALAPALLPTGITAPGRPAIGALPPGTPATNSPIYISARQQEAAPLAPAAPAAPLHPPRDLTTITSLDDLKTAMSELQGLSIKETAMNFVFGEGALQPPVMLIGEAPGEEEDRSGRPFVGPAGQLLEKMLASIGLTRAQVYITNVLPWRPPGNRTPKADEVATCLPYLMRHIELVQPKTILLLGGPAAKALLSKEESVTRLRGTWWDYHSPGLGETRPALVSYHPAYLLRTPAQKRESWRDLRLLKKKIDSH